FIFESPIRSRYYYYVLINNEYSYLLLETIIIHSLLIGMQRVLSLITEILLASQNEFAFQIKIMYLYSFDHLFYVHSIIYLHIIVHTIVHFLCYSPLLSNIISLNFKIKG